MIFVPTHALLPGSQDTNEATDTASLCLFTLQPSLMSVNEEWPDWVYPAGWLRTERFICTNTFYLSVQSGFDLE